MAVAREVVTTTTVAMVARAVATTSVVRAIATATKSVCYTSKIGCPKTAYFCFV